MKKWMMIVVLCAIPGWAGINVTPGVGKTVHTDTVGGEEYQAVKIIDGTTGGTSSATVSTIGLRVDLTTTSVIASTVGVVQAVGNWTLANSTIGVIQAVGNWTLAQTTVGVVSVNPLQISNSTIGVVGTLSDNAASTTTNRVGTLPGVYQRGYGNGVAGTIGKDAILEVLTDHALHVANLPAIIPYSYTGSTTTFSVALDTSDVAGLCGNPTTMVLVYDLRASCTQTTAGNVQVAVVKRSSAYAGSWSSMTVVPQDSNYAVPASTAIFFTTVPMIPGTLVGYLDAYKLGCMASGTATPNDIYISPASWRMKPIVLRGTSQCLGLNIQNATITGGAMTVSFSWMEVPTVSP